MNEHRHSSAMFEHPDGVGLQESMTTLMEQLVNEETRRWVISIVGIGGYGKTTLKIKIKKKCLPKCERKF